MKAISPIIATVILVAVTIALAVGVALWLSGLIGGAGSREQLQVMPDSFLYVDDSGNFQKLTLHLKNTGTADSTIVSIKIGNVNVADNKLPYTVKVGFNGNVDFTGATGKFTPGAKYTVTVYTDAGNSYIQEVTATVISG